MPSGTTRMRADDPRPESVLGRRPARCRRPRRPQNAPSERPADGVGEGDVNHARPRQGHRRKLGVQAVRTNISLSQPRMPMDSSPELLPMRLRMTWKTRSGAAEPGSGGGRGARRHVGRARGRLRPPRRSTRNTWRGRATRRGRARCSWLSRLVARSPVPPEPPCETIRHRTHPERAGTGVRPYRTTHLPRRRPDRTNSAHHSPAAHAMGRPSRSARAAADFVPLRPGFDARPRQSWRSMSGGPGKPSGVTWRPRGRPPGPMDGPDDPTT